MGPTDFQARMQDAARLGRLGADQAARTAETVEAPDELRTALGYWNEMIDIARQMTGKLIDESRNAEPPIPWTEIGSAVWDLLRRSTPALAVLQDRRPMNPKAATGSGIEGEG